MLGVQRGDWFESRAPTTIKRDDRDRPIAIASREPGPGCEPGGGRRSRHHP